MVERITYFRTSDGLDFASEGKAKTHEVWLEINELLEQNTYQSSKADVEEFLRITGGNLISLLTKIFITIPREHPDER